MTQQQNTFQSTPCCSKKSHTRHFTIYAKQNSIKTPTPKQNCPTRNHTPFYCVPYRHPRHLAVPPLASHLIFSFLVHHPAVAGHPTSNHTTPTHKSSVAVASATCRTNVVACGAKRHRRNYIWHCYNQASVMTVKKCKFLAYALRPVLINKLRHSSEMTKN